jgi:hypothetical protein
MNPVLIGVTARTSFPLSSADVTERILAFTASLHQPSF